MNASTAAQQVRLTDRRRQLVATGVHTHADLATLRAVHPSTVPSWVAGHVQARRLFTVEHDGRSVLPAFQFIAASDPRPELYPLLQVLADAGISGWALWTWLTSRTSLLSGEVPHEVAAVNLERVLTAARRFVAGS
jgi:hypothetical protein